MSNNTTLFLSAGVALTVTVPSGAAGSLIRLSDQPGGGDPSVVSALNGSDVTVGPFATPRRYMIVCDVGAITYSMAPSVASGGSTPAGVVVADGATDDEVLLSALGYNATDSDITINGPDTDEADGVGGTAGFRGGNAPNGWGGDVQLNAGSGGQGGGNASVEGGSGSSGDADGGAAVVQGGASAGDGSGGALTLRGGDSSGAGNAGNVTIRGGIGSGAGSDGYVLVTNLPTADPHVSGALWDSAGTLMRSAG